jgi:hypothetical protein
MKEARRRERGKPKTPAIIAPPVTGMKEVARGKPREEKENQPILMQKGHRQPKAIRNLQEKRLRRVHPIILRSHPFPTHNLETPANHPAVCPVAAVWAALATWVTECRMAPGHPGKRGTLAG